MCTLLLCPIQAMSQSVHLVVFCDTNDAKIGNAMDVDHDNIIREMSNIASYIDYDLFVYDNTGDKCNKSTLNKTLDNLECEPEDIVIFFYSGHGTRAMNNENDPFPQMALGSNIDSEFVPLQFAVNKIASKKPQFTLVLSNCCNKEDANVTIKPLLAQQYGPTSISDVNTRAYLKLFGDAQGQAIMTSSKAGQYSWCSASHGGMFTCDVFDVLLLVGQSKITPSWENVFTQIKEKTSARQIPISEPPYSANQTPYYEIRNSKNDSKAKDNDDKKVDRPKERSKEIDNTSNLSEMLNSLVDSETPMETKLQSIPYILSSQFTSNAKVHTLGRNGMTVDYESAADFLRRIALSRRIHKITVIKSVGETKKSEIFIHEIHK